MGLTRQRQPIRGTVMQTLIPGAVYLTFFLKGKLKKYLWFVSAWGPVAKIMGCTKPVAMEITCPTL
jgi:hypothetical protein